MTQASQVQRASRALDEEIAALKQQVALAKRRRSRPLNAQEQTAAEAPHPATAPSDRNPAVTSLEQRDALELLATRTERLELIRSWIATDGDLLPPIARVVGNVEAKYLRKNLVWTIVLSTIFLVAGWLLSMLATPATLGSLIRH